MKTGLTPLKKVDIGKEKKDKLDSLIFKRGLETKLRPQKKIEEELELKKYEDFYQEQMRKFR